MLSLVIPFFNEEDIMEDVVRAIADEMESRVGDYELVLVDNGSGDRTGDIADRLAGENGKLRAVHIPVNQGYGHGIIEGLKQCAGDHLGFMCGDGQTAPDAITKVYQRLLRTGAPICKVRRVVRRDDLPRRIITAVYNGIFPFMFNVGVRDINGTPKIFTRGFYKELSPRCRDWFIDAEIIVKAARRGLAIEEEPVTFEKRRGGRSKIGFPAILEFLRNMLTYRIRGF
jgi:glycosyltransferase involved in cell wall biosynthesis